MHKHRRVLFLVLVAFCAVATAAFPQAGSAKRPMTFEDMMQMKRLGETAVSPDGKWLAYSVTTVDLEKNTKTPELWLQAIAGGEPIKIAVAQPGDGGPEFAPDGKRILFLSGREGGQQVWLADFDGATGATGNAKKLTSIATEADNAKWSPDGKAIVFTSGVYPDCTPITTADQTTGDKCNKDRDAAAAASKVKAQIFTRLLYRHWNHFTGDKRSHLLLVSLDSGAMRDLNPNDTHDVPPFSLEGGGGFDISPDSKELAFTENLDPEPAISTNADIFTLDLTDASRKTSENKHVGGRGFQSGLLAGWEVAWRGGRRHGPGMRATSSGWWCMTGRRRRSRICCRSLITGWMSLRGRLTPRCCISPAESQEKLQFLRLPSMDNRKESHQWDGEYGSLHSLPQSRIVATKVTVGAPAESYLVQYSFTPTNSAGRPRMFSPTNNGKIAMSETETREDD